MGLLTGSLARSWRTLGLLGVTGALLCGCASTSETMTPERDGTPIVETAWDAVRIGTYDNHEFARFFIDIGGYDMTYSDEDVMVLRQGDEGAEIILERMPADAPQARAADATSWEPGCYWSLMLRAKDVPGIVADAEALGWLPKTPVAYLEFGPSKLNVVVLTHQETGAQVQLYERLTTPLPENYPAFERFGVPFNIMQMASDRDASYAFFTDQLGFATFYHGDPFVSDEPELMPLGIPVELTTTVPYRASIVSPVEGMETGRFEMIEIMGADAGLTGRDFSSTCSKTSVGLTDVIYKVEDLDAVQDMLSARNVSIARDSDAMIAAPDGARIRFQAAK